MILYFKDKDIKNKRNLRRKKMKKLIALDLDGTLLDDRKEITEKTRKSLIKAQQRGNTVILASGRPTPGLYSQAEALELGKYHGLLLSYNGGKVTDYTTGEIIYENSIDNSLAKEFLRHLESFDVNPIVEDGKNIYTDKPHGFKNDFESQQNHLGIVKVENICDYISYNPVKILIAAPAEILDPQIEKITAPFEGRLSFVKSAPFYLEATPLGVNKAGSLQIVCDRLGFKREQLVSFGDAENDLSMIEFAGIGVAMANACEKLKRAANMVTLSNNEDGIAYALKKLGIA